MLVADHVHARPFAQYLQPLLGGGADGVGRPRMTFLPAPFTPQTSIT